MVRTLTILFTVFGAVVIAIGLGIYVAGPHATAGFFSRLSQSLTGMTAYAGGLDHPNTDSEMRFFSVFWTAFGAAIVWAARDIVARRAVLLGLLALFFAGGVGRLLSIAATGAPDPLFQALTWVELALPPILALALSRIRTGP